MPEAFRKELLVVAAVLAFGGAPLAFGQAKTTTATPARPPAAATGAIFGEVSDKRGTPLAGAEIAATGPNSGPATTVTTDARGAFTISRLEPGKYQLTISSKGLVPKTQKVGVKAGGTSKVHVRLKPPPTPKKKGS